MTEYRQYQIKKICESATNGFIVALILSFYIGYIVVCVNNIKYLFLLPLVIFTGFAFYMAMFTKYPKFEWEDQETKTEKIIKENKRLKRVIEIYKKTHNIKVL